MKQGFNERKTPVHSYRFNLWEPIISHRFELKKQNKRDAIQMLYGNGIAGIIITLLAATALVYTFEHPQVQFSKQLWWGTMMLVLLYRGADTLWWHLKLRNTHFDASAAMHRFAMGTLTSAVLWSGYCVFMFDYMNTEELAFTIIIVASMAGGGATILAAHRPTAMLYAFIMLIPFSVVLLFSQQEYQYMLGILGVVFGMIMLTSARKSADFTRQAIRLKNENAVLVEHMEEVVEQRTRQIYELSNLDPLTGLSNRTAFTNHLRRQLFLSESKQEPLALFFIDLDGFKKVNDAVGHEIGDKLLMQCANRLLSFSQQPKLLSRWGGDEFLLAIPGVDKQQAIALADRLIIHLCEVYSIENNRLTIGATAGIAMYPEHATNERQLIQLADITMYAQKKYDASTAAVFSPELGAKVQREQMIREALKEAIHKAQLRLVFQPIVNASDGKAVGFEALARWTVNNENIPPQEFIAIAEQYGQIIEIGSWILNEACRQAASWERSQNLVVCVNVSVIQLQDPQFLNVVDKALERSGLPAHLLHIEITESVFAADKATLFDHIIALQKKGILVSIDDFGTEYSSLSTVQDLSVNIIKIDRTFVNNIKTNGRAIIDAVVNIANAFNYQVVAEGVETEAQAAQLAEMGVDFLQGFYYAKPMEQEQLPAFIDPEKPNRAPKDFKEPS